MAGGFLKGAILGGVLSLVGAGVISVLVPLPSPPSVSVIAPDSQVPVEVPATDLAGTPGSADEAPQSQELQPAATAPEPDPAPRVEGIIARAVVPETADVVAMELPPSVAAEPVETPSAEAPVLPTPQALAPMEPVPTDPVLIETVPTDAPQPLEPAPQTELALAEEAGETTLPSEQSSAPLAQPAPLTQTEADSVMAEPQTAEPPQPAAEPVTSQPDTVVAEAPEPAIPDQPAAEVPAEVSESDDAPAQIATAPTPEKAPDAAPAEPPLAEAPAETPDETVIASTELDSDAERLQNANPDASRVLVGKPAVSLVDRDTGVKINRSPGAASVTVVATAEEPVPAPVQPRPVDPDLADKPIALHAQPFDNAEGRPLMSIVLMDDGSPLDAGEVGLAALDSFPYPLSIAVDSRLPDAADRIARYRADGFEVLATIDLPAGAAPSDAEVTMSVTLDKMGEVVAVLEGTGTGLQETREVADQVTEILLQSGHGLVSQSQGLNTVPKLARKAGVPAYPVFRDFDGNDQNARVIRRFLDQAAFKARQEGGVIMLGRLRPETIKALLVWGLADRASQVALAPVSAVLTADN